MPLQSNPANKSSIPRQETASNMMLPFFLSESSHADATKDLVSARLARRMELIWMCHKRDKLDVVHLGEIRRRIYAEGFPNNLPVNDLVADFGHAGLVEDVSGSYLR